MSEKAKETARENRILWALAALLLALLGGALFWKNLGLQNEAAVSTPSAAEPTKEETEMSAPYQLVVQLSEESEQPQSAQPIPSAASVPLSDEETALLLSRLPNLPPEAGQTAEFQRPAESLPPPPPGNRLRDAFPPRPSDSPAPEESPASPLQVTRFSPQGEVSVAPLISVTFNQPMVPLGTLAQLAQQEVPVRIEPPLQGTWRWLGTKTLTFEYDSELIDRLPQATEYRVTVPAGIQSMSGAALAEDASWSFSTPPPKVVQFYPPDSPQPLSPLLFALFDQRIEPAAALKSVSLRAAYQDLPLVLAAQEEIEKDETLREMTKNAPEGRWLVFRPAAPLPADSAVAVTFGPGLPSAEGPRATTEAQEFSFRTYAPLKITSSSCGWGEDCPPFTFFRIEFNNPLDLDSFDEDLVRVSPEIPGVTINAVWNIIEIQGQTRGQTTYTVTLSGKIKDVFGQALGRDETVSFKVGKAEALLLNMGQNFITLDPAASKPVFTFYAVNYREVHLKAYIVQPQDWEDYQVYLQEWRRSDSPPPMPGILAEDAALELSLPPDALAATDVDLSKYLKNNLGHVVLVIEPPASFFESEEDKWRRLAQTIIVWVQATRIGLDAFDDKTQILVWATDLANGAPLAETEIQTSAGGASHLTGADGTARFEVPNGAVYLTARRGADFALLPRSSWGSAWIKRAPEDKLRWFVFDDRRLYQPGEEARVKGWIRLVGAGASGDVTLTDGGVSSVHYTLSDSQGNKIAEGTAPLNAFDGFDLKLNLPKNANLGTATLSLSAAGAYAGMNGAQYAHSFQIEEFRRPEFEVNVRSQTAGPYFANSSAILAAEAKYYAGGGLADADAHWTARVAPSHYQPPNWDDFTFGFWLPWWARDELFPSNDGYEIYEFQGKTDESGTHYLKMDFKLQGSPEERPQPYDVSAYASVSDVNRQEWGAGTSLLIHPAAVYVGLRSASYFVERGTPLKVDFIVTDLDGKPVPGLQTRVVAARLQWKYRQGEWREEETDPQICEMISGAEPQSCVFETPLGGAYQITALVGDSQGRKNQTQFIRWVSGGELPPDRAAQQEEVTLIPDKQSYQPGEAAKILVQSPFAPAEGVLSVSHGGVLYFMRFKMEGATTTLEIPIEEEHIPNLNVQVNLVGSALRVNAAGEPMNEIPPRPAYAAGELFLSIPPARRALTVEVIPQQTNLPPGGETALNVRVTDANGLPAANAELAIVAVDEAILALSGYQMSDPLGIFYLPRASLLESVYGRASLILADPQALAQINKALPLANGGATSAQEAPALIAPMATQTAPEDSARAGAQRPPVKARADFNPLALFAPSAWTDFNGEARIKIKLPDNLTRYRIMVAAADESGKKFGKGEANLTARLPLMAKPSAPRFLNFGDKFELPVVVQNQTGEEMTVNVAVRAVNLEFESSGRQIKVPANDRVEVRFPASPLMAGEAYVQVIAASANYADAAGFALPVYTPATSEAFAAYGALDEEGALAQPILRPEAVIPQYGGLQVSVSSTALQALTDAALYLVEYPYECSEQLASRILAAVSLRDVLSALRAEGLPAPAELQAAVQRDLARLSALQNNDGGFPYWRRGFASVPFHTIHVAHALIRAREKGYSVPPETLESALNYLRDIENRYPAYYSERTRQTLSAYALYVRALAGERDSQKASRLLDSAGLQNLSIEAIGWLWQVIDDPRQREEIRVFVNNHTTETAGAANFVVGYDDQTYLLLSSDRRADAIMLDALVADDPQSDLIPKVVNGLLAHRSKGRWLNTQENVFALIALGRYFQTYESQTPDFAARFWLGNTYAGESEFRGYSADAYETFIPMADVLNETASGASDLILNKEGAGRLYYRLALQYAPTDLNLDPLEMGFSVQRTYEAADDPADVTRDANGVWRIKAGARVRVKVQMVAETRRYHVALIDPLPAGLEIINPALAVSAPPESFAPETRFGWTWRWYEHQNLRNDRAEAFASLLWEGVYEYSYYVRATTPGFFIAPPAKAEEMYAPETFGRSGSDWVIVE